MIIFEISKNYVKALWGKNVLNEIQIKGVAVKPIESDSQEDLTKTISAIITDKLYKEYKPLVLSIPRNLVILRNVQFPAKDDKELQNILDLHLTQEVPYAREEIIHNFQILGKNKAGFISLLLSIIHRRTLVKIFSVFENLNFFPSNILLSTFGLMQFFQKNKALKAGTDSIACMDIGDEYTDFFVFKDKKLLFSKSINMNSMELEDEEKISRLINELKQIMVVFQTEKGVTPARMYISGMKSKSENIRRRIREMFEIPVEDVDPFDVFSSLKGVENITDVLDKVSISGISGVATAPMSESFAFVLPEARMRKEAKEMAKNLFITGGVIIYLLVIAFLAFMSQIYGREIYLNKISSETRSVEFSNRKTVEALDKLKALKGFTKYEDSFLFLYAELSKIMPRNITIDRLVFSKKKDFSILGRAVDMGDIYKLVRRINDEKIFGKAVLRYSRKLENGESEFDIKCLLKV